MRPVGDYLDWSGLNRPVGVPSPERMEERRREDEQRKRDREERIQRLTANGVACFECEDTGRVIDGPFSRRGFACICPKGRTIVAEEERRALTDAVAWITEGIGVPFRFDEVTFESFPDQSSPALAAVKAWVEFVTDRDGPELKPGILIHGAFGRGKTGLIIAALREVVRRSVALHMAGRTNASSLRYERYGKVVTATGLLESLRPHDGHVDSDVLKTYKTTDYLAIDDLGAERLTEWGVDRLFEIVNHRHGDCMPMLVSSNLSPGELAKRINKQIGDQSGDRIVERLIESCRIVRFDDKAPNWRLAR